MKKILKINYQQLNFFRQISKFEIVWNTPKEIAPVQKKTNKYTSISYEEQLKFKKEDFKSFFNNVLITLSYDSKLEDSLKEKQQLLGRTILDNIEDVIPLKVLEKSISLTKEDLSLGYLDKSSQRRTVGKVVWDDSVEEASVDYKATPVVSNKFPESYPNDIRTVAKCFEDFLNTNSFPLRGRLSYYSHSWTWSQLQIRRNNQNKMIIVPVNPASLNETQFRELNGSLKEYFLNGPGKECLHPNDSFLIKKLNPENEYRSDEGDMELIYGDGYLTNKCHDKSFSFYANNYYPSIYESYSNLNAKLADMIKKNTQKDEIIVELDTANGVLGSLISGHSTRFYSIAQYKHTLKGIEANLKNNGLTDEYYSIKTNISKCFYHLKTIIEKHGPDCKINLVFQNFDFNLYPPIRKLKKNFLIYLRTVPQVKQILFVANLGASFKLEQYCYELMTAERLKSKIEGEPFVTTQACLVDYKPNFISCFAIIRLERDK